MPRFLSVLLCALVALPAAADGTQDFFEDGDLSLGLRYRFEGVSQDGFAEDAAANTLRLRLAVTSGAVAGFSAQVEADYVAGIGAERYDDTRNGAAAYPVVADPEGGDLNQAWVQYAGPRGTVLRAGRQRIAFGDERFVGAVGWRQNDQTFDAVRLDTKALPRATVSYAWVDRVQRVFGPDSGTPARAFEGESHLLNVQLAPLPVGTLTFYGYRLDFANAAQFSSGTVGLRDDGERALGDSWKLGWTLEYAQQGDAGANPVRIDASYTRFELRLLRGPVGFTAGREILGGERGDAVPAGNAAFQTPLATLHRWQGWADKFLVTPPAGIDDRYVGTALQWRGWNAQLAWHDFDAQATDARYGSEWDVSVGRKFDDRYELLVKYADYEAEGLFTDTRKFWLQLAATF